MDLSEILYSINQISDLSERYFLDLGNLFPSLLNRNSNSSLQNLQTAVKNLNSGNNASSQTEKAFFEGYADKYNPLFEDLNKKIETLSELDKLIAGIKEDSEQMELIALNAMVISIKSGEKGQAFSRITENLQRLSNDMFLFSDKLLEEEKQLIEHINSLKDIFSNIINSQKNLSQMEMTNSDSIQEMISKIVLPLEQMDQDIGTIYSPIQKAMENLQLQDIIRQALDHIKSCLDEIYSTDRGESGTEDELDSVCYSIALYELCIEVLNDIVDHLATGFNEFDSKWSVVTSKLENVQSQKDSFTYRFLDPKTESPENISATLDKIIGQFKDLMEEFSHYHLVQKDLVHTTQSINEKARTMYSVFGNLRPVMSRLHHVRILQQIEVSKNEAIKSVKDSVTDMDNLINSANKSLDVMEVLLSSFIKETTVLLQDFNTSLNSDNQKMIVIRKEKSEYFNELQATQDTLAEIIAHFTVFPSGFEKKCNQVTKDLSGLQELNIRLKSHISSLTEQMEELKQHRSVLLENKNLSDWNIKNTRFSEIINKFTITAHKEAAGKIAGLEIESGSSSGEITFF